MSARVPGQSLKFDEHNYAYRGAVQREAVLSSPWTAPNAPPATVSRRRIRDSRPCSEHDGHGDLQRPFFNSLGRQENHP